MTLNSENTLGGTNINTNCATSSVASTTAAGGDYNWTNAEIYAAPTTNTFTNGQFIYNDGWQWTIPPQTDTTIGVPNTLYLGFDYEFRIKELETKLETIRVERENEKMLQQNRSYNLWFDVMNMLLDMRSWTKCNSFPNDRIMLADNVDKLQFGFMCSSGSRVWMIDIHTVRATPQEMFISDGKAIVIPECFYSTSGKEYLLEIINAKQ